MSDYEIFQEWVLTVSKIDLKKAIKINNVSNEMFDKKNDWIEKGIVGRFIYKYLGI